MRAPEWLRIGLERRAKRRFVARLGELVGLGGEEGVEEGRDLRRRAARR